MLAVQPPSTSPLKAPLYGSLSLRALPAGSAKRWHRLMSHHGEDVTRLSMGFNQVLGHIGCNAQRIGPNGDHDANCMKGGAVTYPAAEARTSCFMGLDPAFLAARFALGIMCQFLPDFRFNFDHEPN